MINIKPLISTFKGVFSALYNLTFKYNYIREIARLRKKDCDNCIGSTKFLKNKYPKYKNKRFDEHCTFCKCNIFLKTHSTKTKCPNNIWKK